MSISRYRHHCCVLNAAVAKIITQWENNQPSPAHPPVPHSLQRLQTIHNNYSLLLSGNCESMSNRNDIRSGRDEIEYSSSVILYSQFTHFKPSSRYLWLNLRDWLMDCVLITACNRSQCLFDYMKRYRNISRKIVLSGFNEQQIK